MAVWKMYSPRCSDAVPVHHDAIFERVDQLQRRSSMLEEPAMAHGRYLAGVTGAAA